MLPDSFTQSDCGAGVADLFPRCGVGIANSTKGFGDDLELALHSRPLLLVLPEAVLIDALRPLGMASGLATLQKLTALPTHVFIPDDVAYTDLAGVALRGHRQWTDFYLLHLARRHGVQLATFDAAIASMDNPAAPVVHVVR